MTDPRLLAAKTAEAINILGMISSDAEYNALTATRDKNDILRDVGEAVDACIELCTTATPPIGGQRDPIRAERLLREMKTRLDRFGIDDALRDLAEDALRALGFRRPP